ncbi:hypothetical protein [Nocardioides sp. GXZ039]|uniref:hypothetical protein n=1 Tax=Nocardioides sp. GXZ039 TaxID=3136018 RepID=UPI0030F3923A
MATPRTPYDDFETPARMHADCRAAGIRLGLDRIGDLASRPAPSLYYDEQPGERTKTSIEVSDAAARLAGALHFHLE